MPKSNQAHRRNAPQSTARTTIAVQGARVHNLKNISLEIPRDRLVVVTGLSGSGKSSQIYAEGQWIADDKERTKRACNRSRLRARGWTHGLFGADGNQLRFRRVLRQMFRAAFSQLAFSP